MKIKIIFKYKVRLMLRIYCVYIKKSSNYRKTRLNPGISDAGVSTITPHFSIIARLPALFQWDSTTQLQQECTAKLFKPLLLSFVNNLCANSFQVQAA
jgi:hypothetical protein